jgi:hypothetical protein
VEGIVRCPAREFEVSLGALSAFGIGAGRRATSAKNVRVGGRVHFRWSRFALKTDDREPLQRGQDNHGWKTDPEKNETHLRKAILERITFLKWAVNRRPEPTAS